MNHVIKHKFQYETNNLIRVFFPDEKISATEERNDEERYIITELCEKENGADATVILCISETEIKEKAFFSLSDKRDDDKQ